MRRIDEKPATARRMLLLCAAFSVFVLACQLTAVIPSALESSDPTTLPAITEKVARAVETSTPVETSTMPTQALALHPVNTPTHAPALHSANRPTRAPALRSVSTPTQLAQAQAMLTLSRTTTRAPSAATATPTKPAAAPAQANPPSPTGVPSATAVAPTGCPAPQTPPTKPSAWVKRVIMAENYDKKADAPINPTFEFKSNSIVHSIVVVENAPANTEVKAKWYASDVGKSMPCNTLIVEFPYTIDDPATKSIDLMQGPIVPLGTYRVEIYVNSNLHGVFNFKIK